MPLRVEEIAYTSHVIVGEACQWPPRAVIISHLFPAIQEGFPPPGYLWKRHGRHPKGFLNHIVGFGKDFVESNAKFDGFKASSIVSFDQGTAQGSTKKMTVSLIELAASCVKWQYTAETPIFKVSPAKKYWEEIVPKEKKYLHYFWDIPCIHTPCNANNRAVDEINRPAGHPMMHCDTTNRGLPRTSASHEWNLATQSHEPQFRPFPLGFS